MNSWQKSCEEVLEDTLDKGALKEVLNGRVTLERILEDSLDIRPLKCC